MIPHSTYSGLSHLRSKPLLHSTQASNTQSHIDQPLVIHNMRSYDKTTGFRCMRDHNDWLTQQTRFYGPPYYIEKGRLREILRLDYHIRLLAQREESLNYRNRAWKKTMHIKNDMEQPPAYDFDLKIRSTQAERIKNEYTMFRLISERPLWLTEHLDSLRHERLWYMRKEMVDDCAGRGGCCSRGCGCCARRSLSENPKIKGHCTTECWCCGSFIDPSLTDEDKASIALDLDQLLENSNYLAKMVNCYFRPLRLKYKLHRGVGNIVFGLKRTCSSSKSWARKNSKRKHEEEKFL